LEDNSARVALNRVALNRVGFNSVAFNSVAFNSVAFNSYGPWTFEEDGRWAIAVE